MEDFNTPFNRQNTASVKWDMLQPVFQSEDLLPMWIADMDFKAPQQVNNALIDAVKHGIFGYSIMDEPLKDSIVQWVHKRHHWQIHSNWLSFSPSVVTSLYIAIQAFTDPKDKILIQTPVYTPFYEMIRNHDREIVRNSLVLKDNYYQIDFIDLEEKMKAGVKAFILCSPHNPVGRVWTKEELHKIAALCLTYDVLILSDEIHADLVFSGYQHIPIASLSAKVSEQTVTFMSPTKTFNLAGLQASYIVTSNKKHRDQLNTYLHLQGLSALNTMGSIALQTAYQEGESWLQQLIEIIEGHRDYVVHMFEQHAPMLRVIHSEGTYLLWIDCSQLHMDAKTLNRFMIDEAKVGLSPGIIYGEEGAAFMRINIACPKETLVDGVNRIIQAVNKQLNEFHNCQNQQCQNNI